MSYFDKVTTPIPPVLSSELPDAAREHRRQISDYLRAVGAKVNEILDPKWERVQFPGPGFVYASTNPFPGVDTTLGGLLFDAAGSEGVQGLLVLPHGWAEGTTIKPHVHWSKTTSAGGDVYWRVRHRTWATGGVVAGSWTDLDQATVSSTTPDGDTQDEHLISEMGEIDGSALLVEDAILFHLERIGGDAGDTYGADARLLSLDFHIQLNSRGTLEEWSK